MLKCPNDMNWISWRQEEDEGCDEVEIKQGKEEEEGKREAGVSSLHLSANGVFREWTTFQKFAAIRHCLVCQNGEREKEWEMQKWEQWRNQFSKALISWRHPSRSHDYSPRIYSWFVRFSCCNCCSVIFLFFYFFYSFIFLHFLCLLLFALA